jgi:hypothetical protein
LKTIEFAPGHLSTSVNEEISLIGNELANVINTAIDERAQLTKHETIFTEINKTQLKELNDVLESVDELELQARKISISRKLTENTKKREFFNRFLVAIPP